MDHSVTGLMQVPIGETESHLIVRDGHLRGYGGISVLYARDHVPVTLTGQRCVLESLIIEAPAGAAAILVEPETHVLAENLGVRGHLVRGVESWNWPLPRVIDLGVVPSGSRSGVAFGVDLLAEADVELHGTGLRLTRGKGGGPYRSIVLIEVDVANLSPGSLISGLLRARTDWLEIGVSIQGSIGGPEALGPLGTDWARIAESAVLGGDAVFVENLFSLMPHAIGGAGQFKPVRDLLVALATPVVGYAAKRHLARLWFEAQAAGWTPQPTNVEAFRRQLTAYAPRFARTTVPSAAVVPSARSLAWDVAPIDEEPPTHLLVEQVDAAGRYPDPAGPARAWSVLRSRADIVLSAEQEAIGTNAFRQWGVALRQADAARAGSQ